MSILTFFASFLMVYLELESFLLLICSFFGILRNALRNAETVTLIQTAIPREYIQNAP